MNGALSAKKATELFVPATLRYVLVAELAIAALIMLPVALRPASPGSDSSDAAMASPFSCPITHPNGAQPPRGEHVAGRGAGGHGNDELWTNLWFWGTNEVRVPPSHVRADGSLGEMKWPWWRGTPGTLTIEGQRLDAPAPPLRAYIPHGYGARGFQATGLIFPTTGCWQVTGRVGEASLTFVVRVARVMTESTPYPRNETPIAA